MTAGGDGFVKMSFGLQSMYYKYAWGVNFWNEAERDTEAKHRELVCCRGDSAAMQAVVGADSDFMLTVGTSALFWKGGPLPIVRVELHSNALQEGIRAEIKLIGLVEDDDGTRKADMLLDERHMFVEKRRLQQVWIEFHASADARPGLYSGKIRLFTHTLFEDEEPAGELAFSLKVLERVLPAPSQYGFYLDLWQHNSNIARKYQVPLWSDEHFAIIDRYLESLGQLGQKAATLVVSEIPWSGQGTHTDAEPSDLFEYNIVGVNRRMDGTFSYDYSALDRYVELARRHGIAEEIELFGLLNVWQTRDGVYGAPIRDYPDGIRIRYYDEATGTFRFMRERVELEHYVRALEAHFKAKGWTGRVRIMADEPADLAQFGERLSALRRMAPSFAYKIAINHAEFIAAKLEGMRDYVPKLNCALHEFDRIRELRSQVAGRMLYYVCNNPRRPNTFIGSPSIECRIIPWLAARLQLDGFLRWNYTVWPDRPLESIRYRPSHWPAGETNFVYPGAGGKPLLSLRYKWLQRGIRDFELMRQLADEGLTAQVGALLSGVFRFKDEELGAVSLSGDAEKLYSLEPADYDRLFGLLEAMEEGGVCL
ncbi:DUF4091 domain-containing protein [Paenibacillus hamazuiensis]|uniref:DUF4091 domain-containing protein n=1 Tax=Paenibacillus hamazuiensis TaxID=2936508 RepID=UPI00200DC673|nr:DUF4091 domain-containing protein [Paenibacillus hamazuiensis]